MEWNSYDVECRQCGKVLKASSLGRHLADVHDIYQQAVVAEELLEVCPPVLYTVNEMSYPGALSCPYPGCEGHLRDGWMMWRHFRDIHPLDLVKALRRATSIGASDVECRYILHTPDTDSPRSVKSGWNGNSSGRQWWRRR